MINGGHSTGNRQQTVECQLNHMLSCVTDHPNFSRKTSSSFINGVNNLLLRVYLSVAMRAVNDQLSWPYSTVQPTKFIAQCFCPSGFVPKISPYLSPNVLNFYGKQKFKTLFSLKFVLKCANDSTTISN